MTNVVNLPTYGKAITLEDEGIYFTLNAKTSTIHSIFQLVYDEEWYLFQLQKTSDDEGTWAMLGDKRDNTLMSMSTREIAKYFSKSEYQEPRGAWQVIRNDKFGFGKFTMAGNEDEVFHALLVFENDEMSAPVRIHKADHDTLARAEEAALEQEEALV